LAATESVSAEPDIWHESWEPAFRSAQQSGKPVYVYIWERHRMAPKDWAKLRAYDPSDKMNRLTLAKQQVKQMLRGYALCALEVHDPRNRAFVDEHVPGLLPEAHEDRAVHSSYQLPFHLFFDSNGQKVFQVYGYIPEQWFVQIIEAVNLLVTIPESADAPLIQARAYGRLGHLCLELQLYEEAEKGLNRAIELDPENRTGAKADAELDLTIMALPDQPAQACRDLESYLTTYPNAKRRVEVRYFMAVAKYVGDNKRGAMKILAEIAKIRSPASPDEQRWIDLAAVLLYQLQHEEE
jgi:tetratricopeptide (TPR) repeat protein